MLLVCSLHPENKAVGVMKPGHVFTIEPMICEGEFSALPLVYLSGKKM